MFQPVNRIRKALSLVSYIWTPTLNQIYVQITHYSYNTNTSTETVVVMNKFACDKSSAQTSSSNTKSGVAVLRRVILLDAALIYNVNSVIIR